MLDLIVLKSENLTQSNSKFKVPPRYIHTFATPTTLFNQESPAIISASERYNWCPDSVQQRSFFRLFHQNPVLWHRPQSRVALRSAKLSVNFCTDTERTEQHTELSCVLWDKNDTRRFNMDGRIRRGWKKRVALSQRPGCFLVLLFVIQM